MNGYTIRCSSHTYITLEYDGKFIFCLDNDLMYAEEMIYEIEKRTRMNFQDIPVVGMKEDFRGLRFFNGGWKRDFWNEFPDKKEIESYMKLKHGAVFMKTSEVLNLPEQIEQKIMVRVTKKYRYFIRNPRLPLQRM